MNNLELELAAVSLVDEVPPAESHATKTVRAMLALIDQHGEHVLWRVKIRAVFGLVRPSFAIRVRHCRPFVKWLAERAGVPLPDPQEDRAA